MAGHPVIALMKVGCVVSGCYLGGAQISMVWMLRKAADDFILKVFSSGGWTLDNAIKEALARGQVPCPPKQGEVPQKPTEKRPFEGREMCPSRTGWNCAACGFPTRVART